ncbi:MAG: hypothetical protein NTU91_05030, partial [Chloroflexi bacterium]|nr:hypothetical protein [Chloroflexota bacterium]
LMDLVTRTQDLRAVESLLLPVGVDRSMLDLWLIGNAGYWGPPGTLPPPGADGHAPLLAPTARVALLRPALRTGAPMQGKPMPWPSAEASSAVLAARLAP